MDVKILVGANERPVGLDDIALMQILRASIGERSS
jgi:hypothetical protein